MSQTGSGTAGAVGRSAWPAALSFLVVALALLAPLAVAHASPRANADPSALGLSLTAVPVQGSAPLVVELRASLDPSSETGAFQWTFGDGVTYQETASGYSALAHEYAVAGNYTVNVYVRSPAGNANATVPIAVTPGVFSVRVNATPTVGSAPLTVQFSADPAGGTGTYTSFVWHFGDGDNGSGADLAYTYTTAGTYNATVVVTDSAGHSAVGGVQIVVAGGGPAGAPSSAGSSTGLATFVFPLLAILAAAAIGSAVYLSVVVRRGARSPEPPSAPDGALMAPPAAPEPPRPGPSSPEEMAVASAARPAAEDTRGLAERILVHLYWYGRSNIDGVARADASQAGMARRLGVAQNSLSKALRRLVDADAVRMELQHVPGAVRRLKTYTLTPRGEAVARRVRAEDERRPPA